MPERKKPGVFVTTRDTIDSLTPVLKKVALELVRRGDIRIVDVPPGKTTPAKPVRGQQG